MILLKAGLLGERRQGAELRRDAVGIAARIGIGGGIVNAGSRIYQGAQVKKLGAGRSAIGPELVSVPRGIRIRRRRRRWVNSDAAVVTVNVAVGGVAFDVGGAVKQPILPSLAAVEED